MVRCEDKSDKISLDSFIYWYSNIQSQSLTKEHTTAKLRNRYGFTYVDIRDSIVEAIVSGLYVRECCFCLNNRKKKTEISTPAKDCDIIVEERGLHSRTIKLTCTIIIIIIIMFISYIAQSNMRWYDRVRITTVKSTQPNPGEDIHHTVISCVGN